MSEHLTVTLIEPPSVDEFYDAAFARICLLLRDHPKLGAAVNFTEGYEFALACARAAGIPYRDALSAPRQGGET